MIDSVPSEVTICVPCFNNESTILQTLDSIFNQSHLNIIIKIFDNDSTDNSRTIIQTFISSHDNAELHALPDHISAEGNFNHCLRAAAGEFTAILHADDLYHPDFISSQLRVFQANPNVDAVFTQADIIDGNSVKQSARFIPSELRKSRTSILDFDQLFELTLKYGNFLTCPSALVRSSIYLDKVKTWNGKDYKSSADLDVWFRISKDAQIAFISKPLMDYRVSAHSFSHNLGKIRTEKHDLFLVLDDYIKLAEHPLSVEQQNHYNFLVFKDNSLISLNIMKHRKNIPFPGTNYKYTGVLTSAFHSLFHFKFFIYSLTIHTLRTIYSLFIKGIP